MIMKKSVFLAILISILSNQLSFSQEVYTSVLEQIERNSTELRALRQRADAEVAEHHTGLAPDNPTVEAGYLWGMPSAVGPRIDVAVRQDFDFPTVYVWQRRLAVVRDSSAEYQYRYGRQQLLLAAKQTCIRLIYSNALVALRLADAERARQVADAYDKMLQQGGATQQEVNRARLGLTTTEAALTEAEMERDRCRAELQALNGGTPLQFECVEFPVAVLPVDTAAWLSAISAVDPSLAVARTESDAAQGAVSLARSRTLPRWSIGYMGEFVVGNTFQGVTFGLSLPLWGNAGRVRQAQLSAQAVKSQGDVIRLQLSTRYKSLLQEAQRLVTLIAQIDNTLPTADADLLHRAFLAGELSLTDYLLEQSLSSSALARRLAAQRDLHLLLAEMYAFKL